jgi:excisionase family DNA binding protein
MPLKREKDGLSIPKAAELIGVNPQTVRNWVKRGILPATRFGPDDAKLIRIDREDLKRLDELKRIGETGLTVDQAAMRLGVSANTVRSWIRDGKLPTKSWAPDGAKRKKVRIDPAEIERRRPRPEGPEPENAED